MVAAFRFMEGDGQKPNELILLDYIDRFGAQAVMGRTLGAGELRGMTYAGNVRNAYQARANYRDAHGNDNWAEWAKLNPEANGLLNHAAMEADKTNGE